MYVDDINMSTKKCTIQTKSAHRSALVAHENEARRRGSLYGFNS